MDEKNKMKVKFAVAILPYFSPFPDLTKPFAFNSNTFIIQSNFKNFIDVNENKHWAEWLGSLLWDRVTSKDSFVLIKWMQSENPEVLDDENQKLSTDIQTLYKGLILTAPFRSSFFEFPIFNGTGEMIENNITFKNIRSSTIVKSWVNSFFMEKDDFLKWQHSNLKSIDLLNDWRTQWLALEKLLSIKGQQKLFQYGIISFYEALHNRLLDFRFPNLVRAIESIVALPRGRGASDFANRTLQFFPNLNSLSFNLTSPEVSEILKDAYQIRSDCVHGKEFAATLKEKVGPKFNDLYYKYDYVLEIAARNVLKNAISNAKLLDFSGDRKKLECAWENKDVP